MNLISCTTYGVVLDVNRLPFPQELYHKDGSINDAITEWIESEADFVPILPCPICSTSIRSK